jgi:hypothetical protein
MPRMQGDTLFIMVRRTLIIMPLILLSACHVMETNVNVTCPSTGPGEPPPGFSCGGSNKQAVQANTSLATNVIAINPLGGTIPTGAKCSSKAGSGQSYQCKAATVGVGCGITPATTHCKDTYDIGTTMCDCQCR